MHGSRHRLFVWLLVVALLLGGSPANAQATVDIFDSRVFEWRFYVNAYSDLLQNGINSPEAARSHWQTYGIREGRQAHPGFHTRQYLDLYPDLSNALGQNNYQGALYHYLLYGYNEGRRGYVEGGAGGKYGRWTVRNDLIFVSASTRQAGAVDSVWWNGKEFINAWDHGRELQVALSVLPFGEAYNPTEAGSCTDGIGPSSTSLLEGINASGNTLATQSLPAFWHSIDGNCGFAQNTTNRSGYRLNKNVQIGYAGLPHAIQFLTQVYVPENILTGLVIEAPTGYLAGDLTAFYTYNPATQILTQLSDLLPMGEQSLPLILASPDSHYAMGCWSPDLPQPQFPTIGYGQFRFPFNEPANSTMKWNIVFRTGPLSAGTTLHFRAYLCVGSLADVRDTMRQLYVKSIAQVTGQIALEDSVNLAQPLTFVFRTPEGSALFTRTASLTAQGAFLLADVPRAKYTVNIKGAKWLARTVTVDTTNGDVSNVTATLLAGDANNDNSVDFDDLTILAIAYNTATGALLFDGRADFNCDGQVEFEDLTLLAINYNLSGDP